MKQKGGRILGQGSYGCVFEPHIKCSNGKNNDQTGVGKVLLSEHADIEIQENDFSHMRPMIKPSDINQFTNPIQFTCDVSVDTVKKDSDFKKCRAFEDMESKTGETMETANFKQIVYKHKGIDFHNLYTLRSYQFSENVGIQQRFLNVILGTKALFESQNNTHLDIKPQNILQTETNMILIDFGLVTPFAEVYKSYNKNILRHPYPYYPIEFKLYAIIDKISNDNYNVLESMNTNDEYYKFIDTRVRNYMKQEDIFESLNIYGYDSRYINSYAVHQLGLTKKKLNNDYMNTWTRILNDLKRNKKRLDCVDTIFEKYSNKIDVFSLGMSFLEYLYAQNHFLKQLIESKRKKSLSILKKIMIGCLSFNMFERMTLNELIDEYILYLRSLVEDIDSELIRSHPLRKRTASHNQSSSAINSLSDAITDCRVNHTMNDLFKIGKLNKIRTTGTNKKKTCTELVHILPKTQTINSQRKSKVEKKPVEPKMVDCMTKFTVKELRQIAKSNKIVLGKMKNKKEICEHIYTVYPQGLKTTNTRERPIIKVGRKPNV